MNFSRSRSCGSVLVVGLLLVSLGCSKAAGDGQLSDQIRAKFKQDSGLQDKSITVQISGNVVTLSGDVGTDAERTAAARYASMTPGIREVVNNLQIHAAAQGAEVAQSAVEVPQPATPLPAEPKSRPIESRRRADRPSSDDSFSQRPLHPSSSPNLTSGLADSSGAVAITASSRAEPSPAERQVADSSPASSGKTGALPDAPPTPEPSDATASDSSHLSSDSNSDPKLMTIEAGTTMAIRLLDAIDSETAQQGQTFRATLDSPLSVEWDVAIPAGYELEGHVDEVKSAGKFAGESELVLTLDRILVHDKSYQIQTDQYRKKGKNQSTNTAEKVGVGAALGAIIGGIAGGGKGAGIGAAAGGGLGGASQAAGKGQPVRLPSETVLHFTLASPVTVTQIDQGPRQEPRKMPAEK